MAIITITIPDNKKTMVIDSFTGHFGYQPTILDAGGNPIPNPQSPTQFMQQKIGEWLRGIVKERQQNIARDAAIGTVTLQVDAISIEVS